MHWFARTTIGILVISLFEFSSFTNTSYCETDHRLTPDLFLCLYNVLIDRSNSITLRKAEPIFRDDVDSSRRQGIDYRYLRTRMDALQHAYVMTQSSETQVITRNQSASVSLPYYN
jgi:hypothetical protein